MKEKTRNMFYLALAIFIFFVGRALWPNTVDYEAIEEKAYNDVIETLKSSGAPTGMFGSTWYMTQQEVKNLFNDCIQLDANRLVHKGSYCDRPAEVTFDFENDRLLLIITTFPGEFQSPQDFADAFYKVQEKLSLEYGQMPITYDLSPPVNGKWVDQDFLRSEKKMGRVILIHQIKIKDNAAGEQIMMFLGPENDK